MEQYRLLSLSRILIVFICLCTLLSCSEQDINPLSQPYIVSNVEYSGPSSGKRSALSATLLNAYIQFFDSGFGVVTQDGKYLTGSFKFDTDTRRMVFSIPGEHRYIMTVNVQKSNTQEKPYLILQGNNKEGNRLKIVLSYDNTLSGENIQLLAPAENRWRIKPGKRQTERELKDRVAKQLDYIVRYFELLDLRKEDRFDGSFLNPPLYFYSDGVGLLPPGYRSSWNAMFFDSTDASIAYGFVEDALYSVQTGKIKETLPIERYNNSLKQMQEFFHQP